MDFYGLDILGAVTVSPRKQKAAASGQRAVAAGKKLAKRAPRLSTAIVAAGQKAVKVAASRSAPIATTQSQTLANAQPMTQQQQAPRRVPRSVAAPQPTKAPTPAPVPAPAPRKRGVRVGEEVIEEGSEQQADIYTQLADAATSVAEFVGYFQGLLDSLPQNTPIYQQGLGTISQFENWFGKPLESALQGDQAALAKVPDIYGVLDHFKAQGEAAEKRWPWDFAALAEAYLKVHPAATPASDPGTTTTAPMDGAMPAQPTETATNIAKVVVSPSSIIVPVSGTQAFKATPLDAKNKPVSSQSPVTWSASGGATVDPSGNFAGQTAGTYTISATIDGVTGTASAIVQSAGAAPSSGSYGGGGGGYSGGYSGGSGGGYDDGGQGGGYAEEESYPAEQQPSQEEMEQQMYAESDQLADEEQFPEEENYFDDAEVEGDITELGALIEIGKGGKGGGGKGGGKHHGGGHHHHHGGGGGRRFDGGGPWYYGPWWPSYGIEIDEPFDEPTVDDLAEAVAEKLAKRNVQHVGVGLDCLGLDLDVRTPADYRNAVAQLKTSADNLNMTAATVPAWKGIYENVNALYEKYKDAGWLNFLSMSDTTWYAIADAQKRVDEFAAQMRARGEPVYEPAHTAPTQSGLTGGAFDWAKDNWKWLVGGGVALVTLPAILPPIIGAAVAARGRR